ncbi:Hopanoid C-3 methylase [Fundidesulfovibrio magnetotacticus]|uniref:Hopanoid C-3 methylase n=1 Tax=Fundidesulfovibrio magnetotacticus TaxID=2730080 RepID=A0A6V8LVX0_9BACT|nr:radical SAM protein [Fundidesulfovibrio magnetotacticus]GFK93956.1 Hopanoid C-3 methylase [Fundidesulfovibrio magnetotacticus]
MKILLMNVPDLSIAKTSSSWQLEASDIGIFPPIGIMYLAGALRAHGRHEAVLLDTILERMNHAEVVRKALEIRPDVIGMTVYTPNLHDALALTRRLREALPGVPLVWGGPHADLFPNESLTHDCVDYLVLGEAEHTLPRFLDALEDRTPLADIPALVFRGLDGAPVFTGPAGFVKDIDSLPFPAFDALDYRRYYSAIGTGQPVGTICSSRGCPFNCTFCCRPYSSYRTRSVENIMEEMEAYHGRGIREFFFFDDLFNATAKRVRAIAQAILDRGWNITWAFRGRVDAIDEEMLALARRSGCRQILFGVETSTDEGLRDINKKITIAQVRRAMKMCRKAGIVTSTNWIIGFPHHKTREDVLHLIETAVSIDSDFAQFNILIVYHGTKIFEDGVRKGLFPADIWRAQALDPVPNFVEPIWEERLSRDELSKLLKRCYMRFYFRPMPILRKVLSLRNPRQFMLYAKGALKLLGIGQGRPKDEA